MRLNSKKCVYMMSEVIYLGEKITAEGIQPLEEKVEAIQQAPAPTNVSELKSYLGMVNYYQRYLPNLSTVLAPLHLLLQKDKKWTWGQSQEHAFKKSKEMLVSTQLLVHYDSETELILASDASPHGVGSVLSHRMEDGTERPIAYASRTLSPAEKTYSQLEKEASSIIFGVKKFHQYLFGSLRQPRKSFRIERV